MTELTQRVATDYPAACLAWMAGADFTGRARSAKVIRYQYDLAGVTPEHLVGFWVGWPAPPSPQMHLRILRGSEAVLLAIDTADQDRVVGFITAVGDGALASYIPLLEVLPAYQGRGIGTELVGRMLSRLGDRYMVDLVCDEELVPFYERFGMARHGAMIVRRRELRRRPGSKSSA